MKNTVPSNYLTDFNSKRTSYCGAHHGTGEVRLDLTFWSIARDWRGLNTKILVHEGGCVYDVSLRYRVCRFWELALIGAEPPVHLDWAEEAAWLQIRHPLPTLHSPGLETDQLNDWCHAGLWTRALPDFSHPRVVCNSSKIEWKGRVSRVVPWPDFWWKYVKKYAKTSFLEVMSDVQKDSEDVSAGIGIFFLIT